LIFTACLLDVQHLRDGVEMKFAYCVPEQGGKAWMPLASAAGCRAGGEEERGPTLIFIHRTDKVEGGLIVLFFGLVFLLAPLKIFLPMSLSDASILL